MSIFECTTRGCINERVTKYKCRDCQNRLNAKAKERRLLRKNKGLCSKCKNSRLKYSTLCSVHYMRKLAKRYLDDPNSYNLLYLKLEEQNFKCFYTGEVLELGRNVSIDHVLPKSVYPELQYDLSNLVFCTVEVNVAKRDLPIDIFVTLCENVVENKGKLLEIWNEKN